MDGKRVLRQWLIAILLFGLFMASCSTLPQVVDQPATEQPTSTPALVVATDVPRSTQPAAGSYDFEDGTAQGWEPRGDATVMLVDGFAHSGSQSLLVTSRAVPWQGATLNVVGLLQPDQRYEISAYVRLADGAPPSQLILTMQRTPVGGDTVYEWIAPSPEDGVTDNQWVYLTGHYSYSGAVSELQLYVESPDVELVDFYIDEVTIMGTFAVDSGHTTSTVPQDGIVSLHETLTPYFPVGAALEPNQLESADHVALLTRHFNSITAENVMKPGPIHPSEGTFNWSSADRLADFARENNLFVHGHALVWHQQAAEWMFRGVGNRPLAATPENKALVLQRLADHIRAVVGRYNDVVNVWDVVNEVIDENQPDCLRRSRWYELTGQEYIATAFRVAREVAPDAALLINDYSTTNPRKRQCIYNLVQELQNAGVPVDGVGMQMHTNIQSPTSATVDKTIRTFAELGQVHITEFDMSIYINNTDKYDVVPDHLLVRQGERYQELFDVFKRNSDLIVSVTFWGMADDHTWLKSWPTTRLNLPLPFDEALQAKPAYWGIVEPLK